MRKILAIMIVIILMMPQPTFALRPKASSSISGTRRLLKDLRGPFARKRITAAERLTEIVAPNAISPQQVFEKILPGLIEKFKDKGMLLLALSGPAAAGKATFFKRMREILNLYFGIDPDQVLMVADNDYLLPLSERQGADFLQKFDIERLFRDIKALQNGEIIYKPLYDRLVKSRVRIDRQFVLDHIEKEDLAPITGSIYKLQIPGITHEGQELEDMYIDIAPLNNSVLKEFDILEEVNPRNRIVVIKGTIVLLEPAINEGYDKRFFLEADFNTRLIRAVRRYRTGLASGITEDEFINIFTSRRGSEDAAYVIPSKANATVVIDNKATLDELKDAIADTNPLVSNAAEFLLNQFYPQVLIPSLQASSTLNAISSAA